MNAAPKLFLLAVDAYNPGLNILALKKYILDSVNILDWWNYLPGVFIVVTGRNQFEFQNDIQPFLLGIQHLVLPVDTRFGIGWLPKDAWDWLNSRGHMQANIPQQEKSLGGLLSGSGALSKK